MSWYLLHGDLIHAAQMHLLALAGVPGLGYGYAWWIGAFWFGRRLPLPTARTLKWLGIGYAAAFLTYAVVLRNLPGAPFAWFHVPDLTP